MSTRPRRPAGSRNHPVKADLSGAFEGGRVDVADLKQEIEDWKDNLEGNNMEHLPKYDEVSECHEALESALERLEGVEPPEHIQDVCADYTQDTRQSALSRSGRLGNALEALAAAKDAAESWLEANPDLEVMDDADAIEEGEDEITQDDIDERQRQRNEVEEFVNELEEAVGELEGVNFPGMY